MFIGNVGHLANFLFSDLRRNCSNATHHHRKGMVECGQAENVILAATWWREKMQCN